MDENHYFSNENSHKIINDLGERMIRFNLNLMSNHITISQSISFHFIDKFPSLTDVHIWYKVDQRSSKTACFYPFTEPK